MGMFALYANTIRYLKFEQLWHLVTKRMGGTCPLVKDYTPVLKVESIITLPAIKELDYDSEFLSRFSVDELMCNDITLLNSNEHLDLQGSWFFAQKSPLWNHNLHYFEYLFALAKQYENSKRQEYLKKIKSYILAWIEHNPQGSKNSAWECYPIALRLPNWIAIYSLLKNDISEDLVFHRIFLHSLFDQYSYLLNHLEKHLLANHYFEDLKALVIASTFFGDDNIRKVATAKLIEQCDEQILEDGMHFERSPMYQKLILEDLIRVEVALESVGDKNKKIRSYIQKMLNVSYSFEFGLDRLPLFNDCGNNITKNIRALVRASENWFKLSPEYKYCFQESGFYIFEFGDGWKIVVDGGQPGPDYSPGHAHCEAMAFELFHKGKPIFVNCGTFAYQCEERNFFKSTQAHNTVQVSGVEQSECWSNFRMARRARIVDVKNDKQTISMQMTDFLGHNIKRIISINPDYIEVYDVSRGNSIESFLHFTDVSYKFAVEIQCGKVNEFQSPYAEEFGVLEMIPSLKICGVGFVKYRMRVRNNQ